MRALHAVMPELVPRPVGMGKYEADQDQDQAAAASSPDTSTWFFLCEFKDMIPITATHKPDLSQFTALIAQLHHRGVSPDGKFGFPVPTYGGRLPMQHPVSDTWEALFTNVLATTWDAEERTQGVDEEMRALRVAMMEKVVPRLLRPLEEEGTGGKLVPRLVHSDLWHGNVGVDIKTGKPVIFDAVATYAHNECKDLSSSSPPLPSSHGH